VHEKLRLGRYFVMDIVRDDVVLFKEHGHLFEAPRRLNPA
jgi:uncharacterized protein